MTAGAVLGDREDRRIVVEPPIADSGDEHVIQPDLPILPLLALAGALGVVAMVELAAWRRKSGSGSAAIG